MCSRWLLMSVPRTIFITLSRNFFWSSFERVPTKLYFSLLSSRNANEQCMCSSTDCKKKKKHNTHNTTQTPTQVQFRVTVSANKRLTHTHLKPQRKTKPNKTFQKKKTWSLYIIASSDCAAIWNALLVPGWATSCTAAATIAASKSRLDGTYLRNSGLRNQ